MGSPWIPEIRIEAGLSGPEVDPSIWQIGDAARGQVGVSAIGPDMVWVDISPYAKSWSFRRGASQGNGVGTRYEAGTCTIELHNGDRRFDPTNLAGPYVSGGVSSLLPMVRVRITATWAGVAYRLWSGFADSWTPDFSDPSWSIVTLQATDAFKVFNSINRAAEASQGAGEASGGRIKRILDDIGWDANDRVIATGDSTLQATTLADNPLTEMLLVQDSELGELYMDADGNLVFRNRRAALLDPRSNASQVTFGDGGLAATGEIPYTQTAITNDDSTMANQVSIANAGGTAQVAQDVVSQAKYLIKSYERTDLLLQTDADALNVALSILSQNKDPELRFSSITLGVPRPLENETVWPAVLLRELGDRVAVTRRPPGGGDPTSREVFVRGVEMSSDGASWQTTFQFQSAARNAFWTIGNPTLGRIGFNALSY